MAQQFFSSSGDFVGAADEIVVEDFESSPLGLLSAGSNDIGAFNIFLGTEDTDGTTRIVDSGLINGSREFQADLDDDHNSTIRFDFDEPVFGFGADFGAALTGDLLTIEVAGTVYELDDFLSGNGTGFFGVVSDTSFSSVTFGREVATPSGKFFSVDNVVLATAIPEPGIGLVAILTASFAACRRRRG